MPQAFPGSVRAAVIAHIVQHHPSRTDLLPRLLPHLRDPILVVDPGGRLSSAWRCYRLCLRADIGDASHLLVIQDDAIPCEGFAEAAEAAVAARPETAVAFFLGGQPRTTAHQATIAMRRREPWAAWSPRDWWPTVASCYPAAMARSLAAWVDARKPDARGDDAPCGDFFRAHPHLEALVTVPSLVQHPDDAPSLIGRKHMSGKNPGRTAKWLAQGDARTLTW